RKDIYTNRKKRRISPFLSVKPSTPPSLRAVSLLREGISRRSECFPSYESSGCSQTHQGYTRNPQQAAELRTRRRWRNAGRSCRQCSSKIRCWCRQCRLRGLQTTQYGCRSRPARCCQREPPAPEEHSHHHWRALTQRVT